MTPPGPSRRYKVRVTPGGQIALPPEVLQGLGVADGTELLLTWDGHAAGITTAAQARAQVQEYARDEDLVLRGLATREVVEIYPRIGTAHEQELVTSIVRQWRAFDGHAGVITPQIQHWLSAELQGGSFAVKRERRLCSLDELLAHRGFPAELTPALLDRLNLHQTAEVTTFGGIRLRISVDPRARQVLLTPAEGGDGDG